MKIDIHRTHCPLDCPDTCALDVQVEEGRVIRLEAATNGHPDTNGFICGKVRKFTQRLYHPDRLLYPLRRSGAKGDAEFQRISWDEALAEISGRFREIAGTHGSESILPFHYGGSNGYLTDGYIDQYFFARLGASRCRKTLCAVPSTEVANAMYGKMPGVAFQDYPQANFILIWGANPKASNVHLIPYLKAAKRNGAFIAVIDPINHFSDAEIDLHLPVLPGADLPLALAMINYWRERNDLDNTFLASQTVNSGRLLEAASKWSIAEAASAAGLDAEKIIELADRYAAATPAVLRCGWGPERNRHSTSALTAILAIPALLGKFGLAGGGYTMSNGGAVSLETESLLGPLQWTSRELNQTRLGEHLTGPLDPPVKALFVYNCNPAVTVPDQNRVLQGLLREDLFTVVFDQVMTDTARLADIVLPATTFLEHHDLRRGYGSYILGGVIPAIPPMGEARSNPEVFAELGRQMGWTDAAFQPVQGDPIRHAASALQFRGDRPAALESLEEGKTLPVQFEEAAPVQFRSVFPATAHGKADLCPALLGESPFVFQPPDSRFPLALVTPSHKGMITSTFGEFNCDKLYLTIHPEDAARRHIGDGAAVRVYNDLGEVHCHARLSSSVRPGVVMMPKGAWRKSSLNGNTSTALCPASTEAVSGGACFNDARVDVVLLD